MNKKRLYLFALLLVVLAYLSFSNPVKTLTADYPADGANASSMNLTFNCTLTYGPDNNPVNATNLTLFINSTWTSGVFLVNKTNHTAIVNATQFNFSIISLPEGVLQWYCESDNGSNSLNRNVTSNYTLWVDYTSPSIISLSNLSEGYNSTNSFVNVNWTVVDNVATYMYCNVTLDGSTNNSIYQMSVNNTVDNWTIENIWHGGHKLNVTCWDWSGNRNTSVTLNFSVNAYWPAIELNSPVNFTNSSSSTVDFNWTVIDYSNNYSLKCNFTLDAIVNQSNITVANGTSYALTVSGLSIGTHWWNVTCWDWFNHTNTSLLFNYSVFSGAPQLNINEPENGTLNVSKLRRALDVYSTETGSMWYNLDGYGNVSLCTACTHGKANISLVDYGAHYIKVYANDTAGNFNYTLRNFMLVLDSDGNGTIDTSDDDADGDGIWDVNDTIIGNASNINTNVHNLTVMVNGWLNLTMNFSGAGVQNFTGVQQINITNSTLSVIVSLEHNFSNSSRLIMGNVTVEKEEEGSQTAKIVVRNLPPRDGTNKTVYLTKQNSTHDWVCVYNAEPGMNTTLTPTCGRSGENMVRCNGTATGQYHCMNTSDGRLRVWGMTYSVVQTMCKENWTATAWGNCSGGSKSRTVADTNGCGTTLERPGTSTTSGCASTTSESTSTSTSTTSGAATGDTVEAKISYIVGTISPGEFTDIAVSNDDIGITGLEVKVSEEVNGVKIVLEKLSAKPETAAIPGGEAYKYWNFDNDNLPDSAVEEAKIKFKVDRGWIDEKNADIGDIYLARYDGSAWNDLPTSVTKSEADFVYYTATTTGFSNFVIRANVEAAIPEANATATNETKAATPAATTGAAAATPTTPEKKGFNMIWVAVIVGVLGALGAGGFLLFNHLKKKKEEGEEFAEEEEKPAVAKPAEKPAEVKPAETKPAVAPAVKPVAKPAEKPDALKTEGMPAPGAKPGLKPAAKPAPQVMPAPRPTAKPAPKTMPAPKPTAKPAVNAAPRLGPRAAGTLAQPVLMPAPRPRAPKPVASTRKMPERSALLNYVAGMRRNGHSDKEIEARLKARGWSAAQIKTALK